MKIGITETYDPCHCINDWIDRSSEFDMVIFITKVLSDDFIQLVTSDPNWKYDVKPSIIHITCTGWGGTSLETNVHDLDTVYNQTKKLIKLGYPKDRLVLRVDPIIPTKEGLERFYNVLNKFYDLGINRVRISVLDMYYHVVDRLKSMYSDILKNYVLPDGNIGFRAKTEWFAQIDILIDKIKELMPEYEFECCNEVKLLNCERVGCVSKKDLELNGLKYSKDLIPQKKQRQLCLCLAKSQLIPGGMTRGRCPNKCLYCYLKDFD